MAKGARVLDPAVFGELKTALSAYQSATEEDLGAIQREIGQAKNWIEQRVAYWRGQVNRLAHELAQAQAALARCQSEARSSSEQHHSASDCSELQRAVERAKRALEQAQTNLEIAKTWQMQIISTSEEFKVKAQGFRQNVSSQVASAGQILSTAEAGLEKYSGSGGSSGYSLPNSTVDNLTQPGNSDNNPAQKGSDFENKIREKYFDGETRRITIYAEDNEHLKPIDGEGITQSKRQTDIFIDKDGTIWEIKAGYQNGGIDQQQLDEYSLMEEKGYVYVRDGDKKVKTKITGVNYLFDTREGAAKNYSTYATFWYLDANGEITLYTP